MDEDGNIIEDSTNMSFSIDNLNSGTVLEEYYFVKAGTNASVLIAKPFDTKLNIMPTEYSVCKLSPLWEIEMARVDEEVLEKSLRTLEQRRYRRKKQKV